MNEFEKNTIYLIKAVMANRVEIVKEILTSKEFSQLVLTDVIGAILQFENNKCQGHEIFPLYYLSLCNKLYLESDEWAHSY